MSNPVKAVRVKGLREFEAAVDEMAGEAEQRLDLVVTTAADLVVDRARRNVPTRSGRARGSIKSTDGRVKAGGSRAPYFGWLDFGGRVGRGHSVARAWRPEGRYLFPAAKAERVHVLEMLEGELVDLAKDAGLEVSSG